MTQATDDRKSTDTDPFQSADAHLAAIETAHPVIQCAREAIERREIGTALTHIQSMAAVDCDADHRRLRRAEQALLCAREVRDGRLGVTTDG